MSTNPHIWDTSRAGMLNELGITDLSTSAVFVIYAGGQPANANAATTAANTVVASLAFPSTNAFVTTTTGTITANTITADTSCAGGTAAWFSIQKSTGARVLDGSVGTSSADCIFPSTTFATGATISVSSLTISLP